MGNDDARARFIREARAANRIKNHHVVRVIDISTLEGGDLYIVMEFLDGCDLARLLQGRGPLPVDKAVDYVLQACEGLAEAHALGIIHRDLKPENLFAVQRAGAVETIKILDFGISKTTEWLSRTSEAGEVSDVATGESTFMGSAAYMSPEQMKSSRDVDARTDIWALGIVLCELVTGRRPFDGRSPIEIYHQIVSRPMPRLGVAGNLPAGLASVVRTCIARDREARYSSVRDLAAALQPFGSAEALASVERIVRTTSSAARSPMVPADASGRIAVGLEVVDTPKTLASFGQLPRAVAARRWSGAGGWWRHVATAGLLLAIAISAVAATRVTRGRGGASELGPVLVPSSVSSSTSDPPAIRVQDDTTPSPPSNEPSPPAATVSTPSATPQRAPTPAKDGRHVPTEGLCGRRAFGSLRTRRAGRTGDPRQRDDRRESDRRHGPRRGNGEFHRGVPVAQLP